MLYFYWSVPWCLNFSSCVSVSVGETENSTFAGDQVRFLCWGGPPLPFRIQVLVTGYMANRSLLGMTGHMHFTGRNFWCGFCLLPVGGTVSWCRNMKEHYDLSQCFCIPF